MKRNYFPLLAMLIGIGVIFFGIYDADGQLMMFVSVASLFIVIGGSFAALAISFPISQLKKIPKLLGILVSEQIYNLVDVTNIFEQLSLKSRKDGILSLEDELGEIEDVFMRRGLQMVIDGAEGEEIREILTTELQVLEDRHSLNQEVFSKWGALAPGFGMLGTIIGLIIMLGSMSNPDDLGAGMATALITTFYGSFFSNLIFDPIAENLRKKTEKELIFKTVMIEGILMIQSGINPRMVKDKLSTYLSPEEKEFVVQELA
ncbi:MAG: motility protein A [Turicibacter sp.]